MVIEMTGMTAMRFTAVVDDALYARVEQWRPPKGHATAAELLEESQTAPSVGEGKSLVANVLELSELQNAGNVLTFASEALRRSFDAMIAATEPLLFAAFHQVVARGFRVRADAIGYGASLLLYETGKPHAVYLLWCCATPPTGLHLARFTRCARSVRKRALIAVPVPDSSEARIIEVTNV
jgi:tRNA splicing endonuclease